jgi:hypothetical protein
VECSSSGLGTPSFALCVYGQDCPAATLGADFVISVGVQSSLTENVEAISS